MYWSATRCAVALSSDARKPTSFFFGRKKVGMSDADAGSAADAEADDAEDAEVHHAPSPGSVRSASSSA